jgi:predicted ABC-type ATPase
LIEADVQRSPSVVVIAGPNGSGKSSLTKHLPRAGLDAPMGHDLNEEVRLPERYVNADDIARELRISGDPVPDRTAFHHARRLRNELREARNSLAYETVLSHPSGLVDLELFRRAGYHVTLVVVTTSDAEINVGRVRGRVLAGGHDVEPGKIRSRHARFHRFLPVAAELANAAWIFEASASTRLCLRLIDGELVEASLVPPYLQELLHALQARSRDRVALAGEAENEAPPLKADIHLGEYAGEVFKALPTVFSQELAEGERVWHDLALFDAVPSDGERVLIRYEQGYGFIEPLVA